MLSREERAALAAEGKKVLGPPLRIGDRGVAGPSARSGHSRPRSALEANCKETRARSGRLIISNGQGRVRGGKETFARERRDKGRLGADNSPPPGSADEFGAVEVEAVIKRS